MDKQGRDKGARRLAAILFADVEGYSRHVDADEDGTIATLAEIRRIFDAQIERYRGRIANTAGDSVLVEFASAVDALRCAISSQVELGALTAGQAVDRRLKLRMGLHVGDVVARGADLLGDGVNIAARLEAIAAPGGIVLSGAAYDQVRKVVQARFEPLGLQSLKNIAEPVLAFAVDLGRGRETAAPARGNAAPAERAAPPRDFHLSGLRGSRVESLEAPYVDLWCGFFQSMRNRNIVSLISFHIWQNDLGLRCEFTEGRFWGSGPAVAASLRLQCFWEMAPAYDRICSMIFNGGFGRDVPCIGGLVLSPASDPMATPAASPILLFRTGDRADYERAGGVEGMRARVGKLNADRTADNRDPALSWPDVLPAPLLQLLRPTVGSKRDDASTDFVLRMPADRLNDTIRASGKKTDRIRPRLRKLLNLD